MTLENKWDNLTIGEKKFIIKISEELYGAKKKSLNEAKWWNTVGDVVGIFDPTGVVDLINALDYFRQGDKVYGILSLISAVPYFGDIIGKPIIGLMKAGGESAKLIRNVKTSGELAILGVKIPELGKLLSGLSNVLSPLKNILDKGMRLPLLRGLRKTIDEWIELFMNGAKEYKTIIKDGKNINTSRAFSKFNPKNMSNFTKYVHGGMIQPLWGNRATRALMRKTKWYYSFLKNAFGTEEFIEPEDLEKKYGLKLIDEKAQEFNKTDLGNNLWNRDIKGLSERNSSTENQSQNRLNSFNDNNFDIMNLLFGNIFA